MKIEIAKLEDARERADRYYSNRIDELRHQIKKLISQEKVCRDCHSPRYGWLLSRS